jgi:hypothetical protein
MNRAGGGIMLEGQGQTAPGPFGRVSGWFGSQHGHVVFDALVAVGLMAIVLAQSWARPGPVTRWRVHSAAELLARDLRFTQHTAVSASGTSSHAELCLRANGYDIYTVAHQAAVGHSTAASGTSVRSVTWGKDYARGVAITSDGAATHNCTADVARRAFVYLASGAPNFHDSGAHSIAVTLRGQARHVTIQPRTGTTSVGP